MSRHNPQDTPRTAGRTQDEGHVNKQAAGAEARAGAGAAGLSLFLKAFRHGDASRSRATVQAEAEFFWQSLSQFISQSIKQAVSHIVSELLQQFSM